MLKFQTLGLNWIWFRFVCVERGEFYVAGGFLRMFLGPINVRSSSKDIQLKVKEEYNAYRVSEMCS